MDLTYFSTTCGVFTLGFIFITLIAAFTDYLYGKIYNWLTIPAFFFAVVNLIVCDYPGFYSGTSGFGFAIFLLPLFYFGIIGGGDVKILFALAVFLGAALFIKLLTHVIFISGVASFVILLHRRRLGNFFLRVRIFLVSLFTPGMDVIWPDFSDGVKIPFGVTIFIGLLTLLPQLIRFK